MLGRPFELARLLVIRTFSRSPLERVVLKKVKIDSNTKAQPCELSFSVRRRATLPGPGWVQVPSLLKSLTSVFEMGTGVTSSLGPPVLAFDGYRKTRSMTQSAGFKSDTCKAKENTCYTRRNCRTCLIAILDEVLLHTSHQDGGSIGRLVWLG
jgi:hypothetical protein